VPLVASAALGHLLFGDFHMDLTTSLLLGCIPGVWVGAHLSAPCTGPNQVPYEVSHAATEVTKPRSTTASVRGLLGGRGIGLIGG